MLYGLAVRNGVTVNTRWYETLIDDNDTRDEAEKALDRFYSDLR